MPHSKSQNLRNEPITKEALEALKTMRTFIKLPTEERAIVIYGHAKIQMVEKTIASSKEYRTRRQLWRRLPKKMPYQTFIGILECLEAFGKIAFDGTQIIYTAINNPKLKALMKTSLEYSLS